MKQLKSISVMSVFRISLVLGAVAGLLGGIYLFIMSIMEHHVLEGVFILVLGPIVYSLVFGTGNALMAWVYNKASERIGGIEIDLE